MTTDIIIIYKDREVMLELDAHKIVFMTQHSPEEPAHYEITKAQWQDGDELNDTDIAFIDKYESDQIWDKLYELDERTQEDYIIEKHREAARDRHLEDRLRRLGPFR